MACIMSPAYVQQIRDDATQLTIDRFALTIRNETAETVIVSLHMQQLSVGSPSTPGKDSSIEINFEGSELCIPYGGEEIRCVLSSQEGQLCKIIGTEYLMAKYFATEQKKDSGELQVGFPLVDWYIPSTLFNDHCKLLSFTSSITSILDAFMVIMKTPVRMGYIFGETIQYNEGMTLSLDPCYYNSFHVKYHIDTTMVDAEYIQDKSSPLGMSLNRIRSELGSGLLELEDIEWGKDFIRCNAHLIGGNHSGVYRLIEVILRVEELFRRMYDSGECSSNYIIHVGTVTIDNGKTQKLIIKAPPESGIAIQTQYGEISQIVVQGSTIPIQVVLVDTEQNTERELARFEVDSIQLQKGNGEKDLPRRPLYKAEESLDNAEKYGLYGPFMGIDLEVLRAFLGCYQTKITVSVKNVQLPSNMIHTLVDICLTTLTAGGVHSVSNHSMNGGIQLVYEVKGLTISDGEVLYEDSNALVKAMFSISDGYVEGSIIQCQFHSSQCKFAFEIGLVPTPQDTTGLFANAPKYPLLVAGSVTEWSSDFSLETLLVPVVTSVHTEVHLDVSQCRFSLLSCQCEIQHLHARVAMEGGFMATSISVFGDVSLDGVIHISLGGVLYKLKTSRHSRTYLPDIRIHMDVRGKQGMLQLYKLLKFISISGTSGEGFTDEITVNTVDNDLNVVERVEKKEGDQAQKLSIFPSCELQFVEETPMLYGGESLDDSIIRTQESITSAPGSSHVDMSFLSNLSETKVIHQTRQDENDVLDIIRIESITYDISIYTQFNGVNELIHFGAGLHSFQMNVYEKQTTVKTFNLSSLSLSIKETDPVKGTEKEYPCLTARSAEGATDLLTLTLKTCYPEGISVPVHSVDIFYKDMIVGIQVSKKHYELFKRIVSEIGEQGDESDICIYLSSLATNGKATFKIDLFRSYSDMVIDTITIDTYTEKRSVCIF